MFDRNGVPAWWLTTTKGLNDVKPMPNGQLAWWTNGTFGPYGTDPSAAYQVVGLDGSVKRRLRTVGLPTDVHDMQPLANGNFLVLSYKLRNNVDLTAYGGPADATVLDAVIQEIDPRGNLVWSWDSKDHIDLDEVGRWWSALRGPFYNIAHINSVEPDGDSLIASFRHTDAVYSIDRSTGDINWKLGGTERPESLEVRNDPKGGEYPFGGQHDARLNGQGNLTVFDNETDPDCGSPEAPKCARPPRAVEFEIDEVAGTATFVNALADPQVDSTFCCGGARDTGSRGWTVTWGGAAAATGFAPNGSITWRYSFRGLNSVYRVIPIEPGVFAAARLQRVMDRLHPHDGSVESPKVRTNDPQRQRGRRIAVLVRAGAAEAVKVKARGRVKVAGKRFRFSAVSKEAEAGRTPRLRLRLGTRASKRVFRMLDAGRRARAGARVRLVDEIGNRASQRIRVKLR